MSAARARRRGLALALALFAASAPPAGAAPAPAAARRDTLALTVDGVALRACALARGAEQPLVPLDAVAAALGWRVAPLAGGARVSDADRAIVVTVGSRLVREDGDARPLFGAPPVDRGGHVFLSAPDAARLFGVRLTRAGGQVGFARPVRLSAPMQVAEVPRPATPRPSPTPRPAPVRAAADDPFGPGAGRLVLALDQIGPLRLLRLTSQTQAANFQSYVSAAGVDGLGTPSATVVLGTAARSLSAGVLPDPLNGAILRGAGFDGVVASENGGRESVFAGHRLDGADELGALLADPFGGGATSLAVLSRDGDYDQTLLRRTSHRHEAWGDFGSELMIGDRGVGAGLTARTRGRTFLESNLAYASPGLPTGPDDAPVSLDVGRHLSDTTTVAAGAETGPHQPLAPFFGLTSRWRDLLGSVSLANRTLSANGSYQTGAADLQFFTVPGPQRASGFAGTLLLPAATLEADWTAALGTRDASLTARTVGHGVNLIGGLGLPSGGRIGPVVGASVPFAPGLALEGTVRPAADRQTALRLALAAAIPGRRGPRPATVPATVRVSDGGGAGSLELYVDGVPAGRFSGARTTVAVSRGAHAFALRSADGALGSPDTTAEIGAPGDAVDLVLWPERSVRGRVALAAGAPAPGDGGLSGIVVTLEPGGQTARTDADGTFGFARAPVAPDATIGIDPGSLPRELRAPPRQTLPAGEVELRLGPALRIERQAFPSRR